MTKVTKTAENLYEGIANMMAGAKEDYKNMSTGYGKRELTGYSKEQVENWDNKTKITMGKSILRLYRILEFFVLLLKKTLNIF